MRLQRVRFEGEIRFPGLARNTTTFDEADGFEIQTDMHWWVTVKRVADGAWMPIPWTRVIDSAPAEGEAVPNYLPELLRIAGEILDDRARVRAAYTQHRREAMAVGPEWAPATESAKWAHAPVDVPTASAPEPPPPEPRAKRGRRQAPPG